MGRTAWPALMAINVAPGVRSKSYAPRNTLNVPLRSISTTVRKPLADKPTAGATKLPAAPETTMSNAPNCFAMLSRTVRVAAKSRTSQLNPKAPAPIEAAALAAFSGLRPATATRAPSSAKRLAMPRLMPLVPPAMKAVLPANSCSLNALTLKDPRGRAPLKRARDDDLHDFGRAAENARDARIAKDARDRIVVDVAVAAVQLQAIVHDLPFGFRGPHFGDRRRGAIERTIEHARDAVVDEHLGHRRFGLGVGQLELRVLKIHQPLAERLTIFHVLDGRFQRLLHGDDGADGNQQPFARQLRHQLGKSLALLHAQQVLGRHPYIIEKKFGRILGIEPDLVELLAAPESLRLVRFHYHQGHAARSLCRIGLRHDDDEIGDLAVGNKSLRAADAVAVAVAARRGANGLQVRARAGLAHGDGAHAFAG